MPLVDMKLEEENPPTLEEWEILVKKCVKMAHSEAKAISDTISTSTYETVFTAILDAAEKVAVTYLIQQGRMGTPKQSRSDPTPSQDFSYRDLTPDQKKVYYYLSDRSKEDKLLTPIRAILKSKKLDIGREDVEKVVQVNEHLKIETRKLRNDAGDYEDVECVIWSPK